MFRTLPALFQCCAEMDRNAFTSNEEHASSYTASHTKATETFGFVTNATIATHYQTTFVQMYADVTFVSYAKGRDTWRISVTKLLAGLHAKRALSRKHHCTKRMGASLEKLLMHTFTSKERLLVLTISSGTCRTNANVFVCEIGNDSLSSFCSEYYARLQPIEHL